jgi:hypothetical protein
MLRIFTGDQRCWNCEGQQFRVTQALWDEFLGSRADLFSGMDRRPVWSWAAAARFDTVSHPFLSAACQRGPRLLDSSPSGPGPPNRVLCWLSAWIWPLHSASTLTMVLHSCFAHCAFLRSHICGCNYRSSVVIGWQKTSQLSGTGQRSFLSMDPVRRIMEKALLDSGQSLWSPWTWVWGMGIREAQTKPIWGLVASPLGSSLPPPPPAEGHLNSNYKSLTI